VAKLVLSAGSKEPGIFGEEKNTCAENPQRRTDMRKRTLPASLASRRLSRERSPPNENARQSTGINGWREKSIDRSFSSLLKNGFNGHSEL